MPTDHYETILRNYEAVLQTYRNTRPALPSRASQLAVRADSAEGITPTAQPASRNPPGVPHLGTTQSASDESRIRDLQAEADPYYRDHARQAPMAMNGEGPDAYSARLGAGLQHHSATWGKVDLAGLPPSVVTLAKQRIFEDSRKEAESPSNVPDGELRGITRADAAGRNATQFYGSVDAWLGDFKLPKRFATIPEPDRRKVR